MSDMLEDLAFFVNDHQIITFIYDDKVRLIEPHTLGNDGKLAAWQLYPEPAGWRLFLLDKMSKPTFADPRPGYKMGDSRMKEGILAEVALVEEVPDVTGVPAVQ